MTSPKRRTSSGDANSSPSVSENARTSVGVSSPAYSRFSLRTISSSVIRTLTSPGGRPSRSITALANLSSRSLSIAARTCSSRETSTEWIVATIDTLAEYGGGRLRGVQQGCWVQADRNQPDDGGRHRQSQIWARLKDLLARRLLRVHPQHDTHVVVS